MKIINLKNLSEKDYLMIVNRSFELNKKIFLEVEKKMTKVKNKGDKMILKKYQERYGKYKYKSIQVTKKEIKYAYKEVSKKILIALKQMIKNIFTVQKVQLNKIKDVTVKP